MGQCCGRSKDIQLNISMRETEMIGYDMDRILEEMALEQERDSLVNQSQVVVGESGCIQKNASCLIFK